MWHPHVAAQPRECQPGAATHRVLRGVPVQRRDAARVRSHLHLKKRGSGRDASAVDADVPADEPRDDDVAPDQQRGAGQTAAAGGAREGRVGMNSALNPIRQTQLGSLALQVYAPSTLVHLERCARRAIPLNYCAVVITAGEHSAGWTVGSCETVSRLSAFNPSARKQQLWFAAACVSTALASVAPAHLSSTASALTGQRCPFKRPTSSALPAFAGDIWRSSPHEVPM